MIHKSYPLTWYKEKIKWDPVTGECTIISNWSYLIIENLQDGESMLTYGLTRPLSPKWRVQRAFMDLKSKQYLHPCSCSLSSGKEALIMSLKRNKIIKYFQDISSRMVRNILSEKMTSSWDLKFSVMRKAVWTWKRKLTPGWNTEWSRFYCLNHFWSLCLLSILTNLTSF